jgi:large subunit ribosomal protein L25
MEELKLKAEKREIFGKKINKLRKKGFIPAILYGHGIKNLPVQIEKKVFDKVFKKAGLSSLVTLKIGEEGTKKVLISHPQFHPITGDIIHVDLLQVKMTEKIRTQIPIKFVGEAPAVKELDGNLITNKDSIEIECLPNDLIHEIKVDISTLATFDDKILVKDLDIPPQIEVLDNPEDVIALVTPPRSEEELAELEEEVKEEVEAVEVTEEKKEEEEAAETKEAPAVEAPVPAGEEQLPKKEQPLEKEQQAPR